MKKFIASLSLVIVSYFLAYYFASSFGMVYSYFFSDAGTGLIPNAAANVLIGLPTALIIFVTFFLTVLGGKHKYWWIGISLIPAIWFYVMFDLLHIYFPIILSLIAWGLGTLANKTLTKLAPRFMSKIS